MTYMQRFSCVSAPIFIGALLVALQSGGAVLAQPLGTPAPGQGAFGITSIGERHFTEARKIADPAERAITLARLAKSATYAGQIDMAETAVREAGQAALLASDPTIRDLRLSSVIFSANRLAEERLRRSRSGAIVAPGAAAPEAKPVAEDKGIPGERAKAKLDWDYAVELALAIRSRSTRVEVLVGISQSEAEGCLNLVRDPMQPTGVRPDPDNLSPEVRGEVDGLIKQAAEHALLIERPVWRDRALVAVVSNAASAGLFATALDIARKIPQSEARSEALEKLAENQALSHRDKEATATYQEAAVSVASIPQADVRMVYTGVLIDSLIAMGRFDDAKESASMYDDAWRRAQALAAVAESQGRRGLAESALVWIDRDAAPELRPYLYRKVSDGIISAIEQNRGKGDMIPFDALR